MSDPLSSKSPAKYLWLAAIVLLAVAAVIFFFNADGDEDLDTIPDYAVTTDEERMNTDLPLSEGESEDISGMVNGAGAEATATGAATEEPIVIDELEPAETQ